MMQQQRNEPDMTNTEKTDFYLAMNLTSLALPLELTFFIETRDPNLDPMTYDAKSDPYAPALALLTILFPEPFFMIDRLTDEIHIYDRTRSEPDADDDADDDDPYANMMLVISYQS